MVNVATRILAGLLIAAALVLGLYAWTLSRRPPPAAQVQQVAQGTFPVVVAQRRLSVGQPISPDAVHIERLPVHVGGTFSDVARLVERVPRVDIEPGTPVFEAQLSTGFADEIELGERAVAVRVDEASAVGERVRPGNFVDVFLTLKREGGGIDGHAEIARSQARLLLSRVRVLAFGDALPGGGKATGGNSGERIVHARTAVLAVPTEDVHRLALADSAGRLLLALRNPRDAEVADPRALALGTTAPAAMLWPRAEPTPSTLAAAGISLGVLSGSDGARAVAPARRTDSRAGQIEVVRGGRAEMVAY